MSPSTVEPDWVMVGWREGTQCVLLASQTLTTAQLDYRAREYHFRDVNDMRRNFKPQKTLTAHMTDYVVIRKPTYAECLAELLFKHQWRPDGDIAALQRSPGEQIGQHLIRNDPRTIEGNTTHE